MKSREGAADVAFLTTCGTQQGYGHLQRCLNLAAALQRAGTRSMFWVAGDPTGRKRARALGHAANERPDGSVFLSQLGAAQAAGLVVDDYDVTSEQLADARPHVPWLCVIDDLADRELPADLVVNASVRAPDYGSLVEPAAQVLTGPQYALLRPELREAPERNRAEPVERVLVTFGGSDPTGLTAKVCGALLDALEGCCFDVVLGPLYAGDPSEVSDERVQVHHDPENLAELIIDADMAVSAAGQTLYELAAAGLPAVAICTVENQRANLAGFRDASTVLACDVPDLALIAEAAKTLAGDASLRRRLAESGRHLVDGLGASRVAARLLALSGVGQ